MYPLRYDTKTALSSDLSRVQAELDVEWRENNRLREALRKIAACHDCTKPQLREAAQDALDGK